MVRVQIISDTHTEFSHGYPQCMDYLKSDAEVLVVAGDLTTWRYLEENVLYLSDIFPEVVYVTRNHEYYHSNFQHVEMILRDLNAKIDNFNWLESERVVINGVGFAGATLWFPEDPANLPHRRRLCDFSLISNFEPDVYHRHDKAVRFFENEVQEGDVVVTHHMPSYKSVPPMFEKSALNPFFATKLDWLVKKIKAKLWVHGHTHTPCRYTIGKTQVIANPHGYADVPRDHLFKEKLIIDV